MPLESRITATIKMAAMRSGWWVMKIHGGPYQVAGIPDLLLIRNGMAVFLEVKQPGKKATAAQLRRMDEIEEMGGARCYVVTSVAEALAVLDAEASGYACKASKIETTKDRRPRMAEQRTHAGRFS